MQNIPKDNTVWTLIVILLITVSIIVIILLADDRVSLTPEAAQAQINLSLNEPSSGLTIETLQNICYATREWELNQRECNLWAALVFYFEQQEPR